MAIVQPAKPKTPTPSTPSIFGSLGTTLGNVGSAISNVIKDRVTNIGNSSVLQNTNLKPATPVSNGTSPMLNVISNAIGKNITTPAPNTKVPYTPTYTGVAQPPKYENFIGNGNVERPQDNNAQQPPVVQIKTPEQLAMEAELKRLQAKEDAQAKFQTYINGIDSSIDKNAYLKNMSDVTMNGANLKYDAIDADLKNKVAQIIADRNLQLGGVGDRYANQYKANATKEYQSSDKLKTWLSQHGLLGSGIEMGGMQQNDRTYDELAQDIDVQKNAEIASINNEIQKANTGLANDLTVSQKAKADYIAEQNAKAQLELQNYVDKQKAFASDNYWKGANYEISKDTLNAQLQKNISDAALANKVADNTKTYQDATVANDKLQTENQIKLTDAQIANMKEVTEIDKAYKEGIITNEQVKQAQEKIYQNAIISNNTRQTNEVINARLQANKISRDELKSVNDRFDKQLASSEKISANEIAQRASAAAASFEATMAGVKIDQAQLTLAQDKFNNETIQFRKDMEAMGGISPNVKAFYSEQDATINGIMGQSLKDISEQRMTGKQAGAIVQSAIANSGMPDAWKREKEQMYKNVFDGGVTKGADGKTIVPGSAQELQNNAKQVEYTKNLKTQGDSFLNMKTQQPTFRGGSMGEGKKPTLLELLNRVDNAVYVGGVVKNDLKEYIKNNYK